MTSQSEAKFNEMKKNFENIRLNNEKMYGDLQDSKRKEHEVLFFLNLCELKYNY